MLSAIRRAALRALDDRLTPELLDRIERLKVELGPRGRDDFGFDPDQLRWVLPAAEFVYRHWFRVEARGLSNLPEGRVLLVANHSGQIPIDAMMIGTALLVDAEPPRAIRSMVERLVPTLPFVGVFFARLGQVLGTPENCRRLLAQGAPVLVFPEGVRGINKTYDRAYELQEFGHGFMRLALETNTPIIPVGVVGAEEQYPAFWNLKPLAKAMGLPAAPVGPTMLIPVLGALPLPVKYRIYFGRPMHFSGDPNDDETEIGAKVRDVKDAIASLLNQGLGERQGFFR